MDQGTEEWFKARIGKITSSRLSDVLTGGTKGEEFGKTAWSYAYDIVTEELAGHQEDKGNEAMNWGSDNEAAARERYEVETLNKVKLVGFELWKESYQSLPSGVLGGSPDGLVGEDGIIEIKCPFNPRIHLHNFLSKEVPKEYVPQIQGNLLVTNRKFCDFVSYCPRFSESKQISIVRVFRDDLFIGQMLSRVERFYHLLESIRRQI